MWAAYLVKEKGMSYEDAVKAGEAMNLNGYKPANATSTPVEDLLGDPNFPSRWPGQPVCGRQTISIT